jgi:hypothetical protein
MMYVVCCMLYVGEFEDEGCGAGMIDAFSQPL